MRFAPYVCPLRSGRLSLLLGLGLLAIGCASAPPPPRASSVFFPPAPDLPRVQFLTSFSGSKDIESQSGFDRFVVGERPDIKLDKPYGVAMYKGKIYVCDVNHTVVVFDLTGKSFTAIAGATGPGKLLEPLNISIDAAGTKYVTDPARGQIVVFDANDQYVRAYGTPGEWRPVDAVPYEGRLYVVDGAGAKVRVFDLASGDEVKTIGDKGEAIERLNRPTNIAFEPGGDFYVSDVGRFQVVRYDRDGHYKSGLGKAGDNLGHFARPKGVAVDRDGRLMVVDAAFNNVQIFNPQGHLLMFFGAGQGQPGGFTLPAKISLDYDDLAYFKDFIDPGFDARYLMFVSSQFGERLINVFAFGSQKGKTYPTDAELEKLIEEARQKELAKEKAAAAATPAASEPPPSTPPPSTPPPPR